MKPAPFQNEYCVFIDRTLFGGAVEQAPVRDNLERAETDMAVLMRTVTATLRLMKRPVGPWRLVPDPAPAYVKPRGVCSVCGKERALRADGNVSSHYGVIEPGHRWTRQCPGSRKPPSETVQ